MKNPFEALYLAFDRLSQLEKKVDLVEKQVNDLMLTMEKIKSSLWTKPAAPIERELVDVNEAAKLTGFKPAYIYQLVKKQIIPYIKIGRKLQFDKKELEDWLLSGRSKIVQIAIQSLEK